MSSPAINHHNAAVIRAALHKRGGKATKPQLKVYYSDDETLEEAISNAEGVRNKFGLLEVTTR